ncbi:MAG: SAM-dependent methyltransferase [Clostridia bacterium]|nr:SAM-dependent methyltransferase [Clostridia bacterium]
MEEKEIICAADRVCGLIAAQKLDKIVFSIPYDKNEMRTEGRLVRIKNQVYLQTEKFTADGKAFHTNVPSDETREVILNLMKEHKRTNVITPSGNAELMISKKGKSKFSDRIRDGGTLSVINGNDRLKNHILNDGTVYQFLVELGVSDPNGTVFDKKRAKFRQIDRFLNYVDEIYPSLPASGQLNVLDLCCGKSYLTFAAYWFLTEIKKRQVNMTGADIKRDVIAFCSEKAKILGYDGLSFICADITTYEVDETPDLVLSLHACDTATDVVLLTAARLKAKVILSTPCCHHEIFGQLKKENMPAGLEPLDEFSLLKQKFAVALTDTLRCKRLQAAGYRVDVTELVDPENTPKNLMIRAVYNPDMSEQSKFKYRSEYEALSAAFGVFLRN